MQINTAYAHNSSLSLKSLLPSHVAPTATHVMMDGEENVEKITGFIFLCNRETKPECYRYRVFGLPRGNLDIVEKIEPGTKLFLFDFGVKRLYGIYTAISWGGMNLEPAAFNGKFPAQVRFKIVSDCLPLAESALKHAIRDNYQGSKFRQELSTEQVKTLVSLFWSIDLPPSTSGVATFANVAPAHAYPSAITVEKVLPPARPHSLYLPGANHAYTFLGGLVQPSKHLHYVPHNTLPPQSNQYYSAEAHLPYLPEKSLVSAYDPRRRQTSGETITPILTIEQTQFSGVTVYEVAMEMCLRNHVARHENQHHVPQLPKDRDTVLHSDNVANDYNQNLPSATASHASLQSQGLAPSYALPASSSMQKQWQTQQPLQSTYQSYYTQPTHENQGLAYNNRLQCSMLRTSSAAELYLPVSAKFSFAGAASTYQH
ncbi:unnamed protein product [Dovyalis caffra]|uniref:DCD domain-containing protein n=1 Tax=Dovyalis caffra TaxID=77055 RepID=A0AAV1SQ08_9ROSI|nr:unnamed protein product [Dovyalis caffra]